MLKWEVITLRCIERCWKIAKEFYTYALFHTAPEYIATQIAKKFMDSKFEVSKVKLSEKLKELLRTYQNRDFFTLNEEDLKRRTDAADFALLKYDREIPPEDSKWAQLALGPTRAQKVLNWVFEAYAVSAFGIIATRS